MSFPEVTSLDPQAGDGPVLMVVFSKDRPLQLHATLASLRSTCLDPENIRVRVLLYASTDELAAQYLQVGREHPWAELVGEDGFKATLLAATAGSEFLGFVVDDTVFVRPWRARDAGALLHGVPRAIGVSLRLGRNTTSCYPVDRAQAVPAFIALPFGWLACDWTEAELDFAYPLELSSSIYRSRDVRPLLERLEYRNPNELEARLSQESAHFKATYPALVLPPQSLAFSVPLNVVQRTCENRHGARADRTPEALSALFDAGARIDVAALQGYVPRACHEEVELPLTGLQPMPHPVPPRPAPGERGPPTVSVVIPCWNQAQYLRFAISSVVLQRFTDWEVIVVDDGSPDDTAAVFASMVAQLPGRRLTLVRQENAGLANARNAGFQVARGRYLLPLDADDALEPTFLERTVALLDADPSLAIAYTDAGIFGARDGVWETHPTLDVTRLRSENGLPCCSLFRREVWERTGGYRANMSAGYEDWDFWLGAAAQGFTGRRIPAPLFLYREKPGSMLDSARLHDAALRAQLQLNHPTLFTPAQLADARLTLTTSPLPPAKAPSTRRDGGPLAAPAAAPPTAAPQPQPQPRPTTPGPAAAARPSRPTLPSSPADPAQTLEVLRASGAWHPGAPLRLHLGCGERRQEGYVNVDLPPGPSSIMATRADVFGDVPELRFPPGSVDEIRSHHVFEHFPRVEALALLVRWHEWLRPGGRLVIETPDLEGSARSILSDQPLDVKLAVVRHLAGDQAEGWAFHVDHWFPARLRHTLGRLGFGEVQVEQRSWPRPPFLSDVVAIGTKTESLGRETLIARADELLTQSLVVPAEEQPTLERWRQQLRRRLAGGPVFQPSVAHAVPAPAPSTDRGPIEWIAAHGARAPLDQIVDFNQRERDRWVAARAAATPAGARILDVGAGTCPYRARFAHCDYVAHDFSAYQGEKLGGGTAYGKIDLVSDVTAIPSPDASFDVVLCTEVLEHVPRPIDAVREMTRLLRPGGRLLLTAPLGSGLHQLPYHYYGGFSPEWYRELARQLGLEIDAITPNGGFFRLMAQESARAADLLSRAHVDRPPDQVLQLLGEHLPRWFEALDSSLFHDQFTVGYFVEAHRPAAPPRST